MNDINENLINFYLKSYNKPVSELILLFGNESKFKAFTSYLSKTKGYYIPWHHRAYKELSELFSETEYMQKGKFMRLVKSTLITDSNRYYEDYSGYPHKPKYEPNLDEFWYFVQNIILDNII